MTCLEHLIENQLARFEEHPEKTYEQYIDDIKADINFEGAGITAEQCYEITQYMLYSYCSNCPSKHQDKRNNGKWIFKDGTPVNRTLEMMEVAVCDQCGESAPGYPFWECDLELTNFCPNCGADMREEKTDANNGA